MTRLALTSCFLLRFLFCHSQLLQKNKTADYGGYLNQQGFVKNAGQFTDEKNDEVPGLLYGTHIGNCGIYITNKGLSYINFKIVGKDLKKITGKNKKANTIINYRYDIERIDITIKGAVIQQANAEEAIEPGNKVSYNYYTAFHNEGINGIRPCKEVTFKNI